MHSILDSAHLQFELSIAHNERLFDHEQGLRLMQQVHANDVRFVSGDPVRSTASTADNYLAQEEPLCRKEMEQARRRQAIRNDRFRDR